MFNSSGNVSNNYTNSMLFVTFLIYRSYDVIQWKFYLINEIKRSN